MNKKQMTKLIKDAKKEYNEEKYSRAKLEIKRLFQEYEMAKATVKKLEKQMKHITSGKISFDEEYLIDYDE